MTPRVRRSRRPHAFGLLEVMVSGALLLLAIGGALVVFTALTQQYDHQRHLTHAIHVAEGTLEQLLARYTTDAELQPNITFVGPSYDLAGKVTASAPYYSTSWRVTDHDPIPETRRVRVTVAWSEGARARTFSLEAVR